VKCILIGSKSRYGLESTVVDCTSDIPKVLRPGVITLEELRKVDPRITLAKPGRKAKSPGTKYRHYSPKAKVVITGQVPHDRLTQSSAYIGFRKLPVAIKAKIGSYKHCISKLDYAKTLFSFFRECDAKGIKIIYAEKVDEQGIGLAIMNRLRKAAT
jgi:L-threonylcarbamoyladenylate synthase